MESKPTESAALVSRASRGDDAAVAELLERHLPDLRRYMRLRTGPRVRARESCSDLVQSVCREVLEDMEAFDYRSEGQFRSWLFKLAYRKIVDKDRFHAAGRRDVAREEAAAADEPFVQEKFLDLVSPSRVAMNHELEERLAKAFAGLSDEHREAILLTRIVGLSQEEAGREMNRSVGAVRMLVYRGIARLGLAMDERTDE